MKYCRMTLIIKAEKRELSGRATDALREEGIVPGVLYGFDTEPVNIQIPRNILEKLYTEAGESTVIDLEIEGKTHNVLIQDVQRNPLTDFLSHIDFRKIDMTKKVETTIPIEIVGESPAVKELGGTLIQSLDAVEVRALPSALVREFEVDAGLLKTFDDVIRVSDIKIPDGMEITTAIERSVATVQPPRTQQEMDALDGAPDVDVSGVEVPGEKKEDAGAPEKDEKKSEDEK